MAYRFIPIILLSFFSTALISVCFPRQSYGKSMAGKTTLFIQNKGQVTDQYGNGRSDIDFKLSATNGLNLFIGKGALHYQWVKTGLHSDNPATGAQRRPAPSPLDMYRMDVQLIGANPDAAVTHEQPSTYYERYYLPSTGDSGIFANSYQRIIYHDIYPHIDWMFYFNADGKLEHDFIVHPGGKASDIKLQYGGADNLQLTANGSLSATTPLGTVSEQAPYAYEAESKYEVKSRFILQGNVLSFSTTPSKGTLIIDPILDWGTYFGGNDIDYVSDMVAGKAGRTYLTGATNSAANIATTGAFQTTYGGGPAWDFGNDAFISKFDISGDCLWSTYYGTSDEDVAKSISKDTSGNLYIAGYSYSTTGLSSAGAYQSLNAGSYDAFIAAFDTSGQRIWGTYFGGVGDDAWGAVALHCDRFNNIYLTGQTNSPTGISTIGSYQPALYGGVGDQDAFLAKFSTTGNLLWSTYFGGNFGDAAYAVTNDASGNCYIAGNSNSTTGIASMGQASNGGSYDAFIAKFDPSGNKAWSTYLGGNLDDYAFALDCDSAANIYLGGTTVSTSGLATSGAFQGTYGGGYQDGLLAKFNTTGNLLWATYYGGSGEESCEKIYAATTGNIYVSGYTGSPGLATGTAFQPALGGSSDGFISRFGPSGTPEWCSYMGGIDADDASALCGDGLGNLFIGGNTMSATGIATAGSWQPTFGGGDFDGFLMRVKDCSAPITPDSIQGLTMVCAGTVSPYLVNNIANALSYTWILPSGWTGSSTTNSINVTNDGNNGILKVVAVNDCDESDTVSLSIAVNPLPPTPVIVQNGNVLSVSGSYATYQWNKDGQPIVGATNPTYVITGNGSYSLTVGNANGCSVTSVPVTLHPTDINELLHQNGITVYPNPVSDNVFINTPLKAVAYTCNITGQVLQATPLFKGVNAIDMRGLSSGMYLLRIIDQSGLPLGNAKITKSKE